MAVVKTVAERVLICVWDNPDIIRYCIRLAVTLSSIGFRPVFTTPTESGEKLIVNRGFEYISLEKLMIESKTALQEWRKSTQNVLLRMKQHREVNLYKETQYERICISRGYTYPLCDDHGMDGLFDKAFLCIESFSKLIDLYKPKVCFVWNGLVMPFKVVKTLCNTLAIPVFSLERGLLPGFMVVDQEGINFGGSLGGLKWHIIEQETITPNKQIVTDYISKFASERTSVVNKGIVLAKEEIVSALNVPSGKRIVLIPNQIDSDTNIIYFSNNFLRNADVIENVVNALRPREDVFIIVKMHPEDSRESVSIFEKILENKGCVVSDFHVHSLLDLASLVIVRNSTVGLESLILGKPVICLGLSAYSGKGFTYDVQNREELPGILDEILADVQPVVPNIDKFLFFLSYLLKGYHFNLSEGIGFDEYNKNFVQRIVTDYWQKKEKLSEMVYDEPQSENTDFKVIAIIAAHNEADVIYHVIGDLIKEGIQVYLIDHCSTDNTVQEALKWLHKGLIHVENFPEDAGYSERNKTKYIWSDILRRKEELALDLNADWFIHHDADEFRESPWVGLSLCEAIETVDKMGYNAIDFELFNFRPVDDSFVPGQDVREYLHYYDEGEEFDKVQVKAWKKRDSKIDLVSSGGHEVEFNDRRAEPVKFILRHYPIRSQQHGIKKVFKERKPKYIEEERNISWHVQYDSMNDEDHNFLSDPSKLNLYDGKEVRLKLLSVPYHSVLLCLLSEERQAKNDYIRGLQETLRNREDVLNSIYASKGWKLLKIYYNIRDFMLRRTNEK